MLDGIMRVKSRIQEIKSQIEKVQKVNEFNIEKNLEKSDINNQEKLKETESIKVSEAENSEAFKDELLKKFNLSGLKVDDIRKNNSLDFYKIMQENLFK